MLDYNSCKVMQLSNSLILSIYDNIIKFYRVNIIHNLYEQVKKIELTAFANRFFHHNIIVLVKPMPSFL